MLNKNIRPTHAGEKPDNDNKDRDKKKTPMLTAHKEIHWLHNEDHSSQVSLSKLQRPKEWPN